MTCRHDERLDVRKEWKSGRNEWKREGRNGCVCCVLRVCVSERIQRGGEGEDESGESRSLRSATIVVEHLRESGARREEEKNGYHVESGVCCRSIRTKRRACAGV